MSEGVPTLADLTPRPEHAARFVTCLQGLFADLGYPLGPTRPLLDLGCGAGETVSAWLDRGYEAYGVDLDPQALARAHPERCRLLSLSPYRIPFPDHTFAAAFSEDVFEHVDDYGSTLRELRRVLRPGGAALHVFPARCRPLEAHVQVPLGGMIQTESYLRFWARLGVRADWQGGMDAEAVTRANLRSLQQHTNYLTRRQLEDEFGRHFEVVRFVEPEFLRRWFGRTRYLAPLLRLPGMARLFSAAHLRVVLCARAAA